MQLDTKTSFENFQNAIKQKPSKIIEVVKKSEIKGRGGASFPTGLKWEFTTKNKQKEKLLICNADEGEPGTFKDKYIIENNPSLLIEGISIASYAINAKLAIIYLRGEYSYLKPVLEKTIKKHKPDLKKIDLNIHVILGAGAYICGEETAIINSIQGKRGEPRLKPPYPAQEGLYYLPTCVNNVETLANIPLIIKGNWQKTRLFSVSGNVKKPGIYEGGPNTKLKKIVENAIPTKKVKAILLGYSAGILDYEKNKEKTIRELKNKGQSFGSGAIIVLNEKVSLPKICAKISEFFSKESCGKCFPCREGNIHLTNILKNAKKNMAKKEFQEMLNLSEFISQTSFCGLGQASTNHVKQAAKQFKGEFLK